MTKYRIRNLGYTEKPYYVERRSLFIFWVSPNYGHFTRMFETLDEAKAEIERLKKIDQSPTTVWEE